jgi:tripartite-type tricarboxylate transporter receptor subunit TctC
MKLQFHAVAQALVVLLSLAAGAVCAQAYPVKPVRVVIPWPPGGGNDIAGRIVMQKLAENLGQQIVIDNRAGASGTIGSEFVAKAAPDGYTLMVHSTTHVGNPHLFKKLAYDTLRDFAPVALLTAQPTALTVHPSLPVKSVKEFIALAKSRPNDIIYSTAGNGSAPHLSMALFESMTGIRMVHVPYKGGGPQVIALLAGESQASLAVVASVINHIKAGAACPP